MSVDSNMTSIHYLPKYDPDFIPIYYFFEEYRRRLAGVCSDELDLISFVVMRNSLPVKKFQYYLIKAQSISGKKCCEGDDAEKKRADTLKYVDRLVKTALWVVGGDELSICAPEYIYNYLSEQYKAGGDRGFDIGIFEEIFGRPFRVSRLNPNYLATTMSAANKPAANTKMRSDENVKKLSNNPDTGLCRIGIDLGGSTIGVSAFSGDEKVYEGRHYWLPKLNSDPQYHFEQITNAIRDACIFLQGLDFIGISCAGISIDGRLMSSALFREVPSEMITEALEIFDRISRDFGGVPYVLANDGEVSALAAKRCGADALILALTLGTSLGCGYVDSCGVLTGHINELSFVPLDASDVAIVDEWSGDSGVGVSYLSQDAAIKLAENAGLLPNAVDTGGTDDSENPSAAEKFAYIVKLFDAGDSTARQIFEDIGIYLGYSIPFFREFFEFEHISLQGGVAVGNHGRVIIDSAKKILASEFPELFSKITFIDGALVRSQADAAACL